MGRINTQQRDLTAHTASVKCTRELLDGMTALVWDFGDWNSPIRSAWRNLGSVATQNSKWIKDVREEDPFLVPYSIVVTVLQQITDGYVYLDKYLDFMVTLNPVEPATLKEVFSYLEGVVRRVPLDEIPFMDPPDMAERIANTKPQRLSLADSILQRDDGKPANPDNWAYEAVKWHIAKKLAGVPFLDQGMEPILENHKDKDGVAKQRTTGWKSSGQPAALNYRPLTSGELIAWENPIGPAFASLAHPVDLGEAASARPENPSRKQSQYALSYVSVKMATYTAEPDPVLNLDAHIRRINNTVIFASTVMVDQGRDRPLLSLSLGGFGLRQTNRHALEILSKMDADRSELTAIEDRVAHERSLLNARDDNGKRIDILTPWPGTIRPIMPKSDSFAVGTGAGLHHLAMLQDHLQRAFNGKVSPVELKSKGNIFVTRTHESGGVQATEKKQKKDKGEYIDLVGKPSPESIRRSIETAGHSTLRILCLWYRDETRMRMIHGLAHSYDLSPDALDPVEGESIPLAPGIEAVFANAQDLLEHGPGAQRASETEKITGRFAEPGVLLAAWCETEIPVRGEEHQGLKAAEVKKALEENDAKHQVVRELAKTRIPSQFLVGRTYDAFTKTFTVIKTPEKAFADHRVYMGLLDLYRSSGVVDDRFERALYPDGDAYQLQIGRAHV